MWKQLDGRHARCLAPFLNHLKHVLSVLSWVELRKTYVPYSPEGGLRHWISFWPPVCWTWAISHIVVLLVLCCLSMHSVSPRPHATLFIVVFLLNLNAAVCTRLTWSSYLESTEFPVPPREISLNLHVYVYCMSIQYSLQGLMYVWVRERQRQIEMGVKKDIFFVPQVITASLQKYRKFTIFFFNPIFTRFVNWQLFPFGTACTNTE